MILKLEKFVIFVDIKDFRNPKEQQKSSTETISEVRQRFTTNLYGLLQKVL